MDTKGGRISITISGQTFTGRGKFSVMPSTVEVKADANQDGSAYRTVKPVLSCLKGSFDRGIGIKWDEAMMLQDIDATFIETDAKVTHLFTTASWANRPEIDSETGEVTGLEIHTDKYQSI